MILDTSVLFDAVVPGPSSARARAVLKSTDLTAPELILVEIADALTRAVRRGAVDAAFARAAYPAVEKLLPPTEPNAPLMERAFALSLELTHPLSDCVFLAQAEARADVLVTADERLVRKLAGSAHAARAIHVADWRP
ncbi:MAG TPA: type II toxin-antitoxin system VapC family toxin [Salinarimonas sp.]|nr:type II toxin-antitoxin system VapC family toxin [Salinarimonas sp.]